MCRHALFKTIIHHHHLYIGVDTLKAINGVNLLYLLYMNSSVYRPRLYYGGQTQESLRYDYLMQRNKEKKKVPYCVLIVSAKFNLISMIFCVKNMQNQARLCSNSSRNPHHVFNDFHISFHNLSQIFHELCLSTRAEFHVFYFWGMSSNGVRFVVNAYLLSLSSIFLLSF